MIDNKTKKYEWKADDLQRDGGAFQGGRTVMVCLGASYFGGVGRPYFVRKGQLMDQAFYLNVLNSHYVVAAARMLQQRRIIVPSRVEHLRIQPTQPKSPAPLSAPPSSPRRIGRAPAPT